MGWEDSEEHDDAWAGPPLPPEDRLWRHPAELGAEARVSTATTTVQTPWRHTLMVAGVSALASGVLVAGLFLALRPDDEPPPDQSAAAGGIVVASEPFFPIAKAVPEAEWPALVAEQAGPAIAKVTVTRTDGTVRHAAGFLIRPDGYLLTSHDALEDAERVTVTFSGASPIDADAHASDVRSGVGVIAVSSESLPPVVHLALLKPPPELSEHVLVVDGRRTPERIPIAEIIALQAARELPGRPDLHGLLLLDTPMTPAASGAPVLDDAGDALGVAIDVGNDEGTYVVPISYAVYVATDLIDLGWVNHTWLGITGASLSETQAEELGLAGGVEIAEVLGDSPATEVSLQPEDVIVRLDDRPVHSMTDLILELREHPPETTVEIEYLRGSDLRSSPVRLASQPPSGG